MRPAFPVFSVMHQPLCCADCFSLGDIQYGRLPGTQPVWHEFCRTKLSICRIINGRNLNGPAIILKSSVDSLIERERLIGTHENGPFLMGAH
jgi:hypothetical protein